MFSQNDLRTKTLPTGFPKFRQKKKTFNRQIIFIAENDFKLIKISIIIGFPKKVKMI